MDVADNDLVGSARQPVASSAPRGLLGYATLMLQHGRVHGRIQKENVLQSQVKDMTVSSIPTCVHDHGGMSRVNTGTTPSLSCCPLIESIRSYVYKIAALVHPKKLISFRCNLLDHFMPPLLFGASIRPRNDA